jgi:polynucleotide 5'-kinase involved in rRNA processing
MEMDRIINFLMLVEPTSTKHVGVLPIVGQAEVGKSTLVAHVCNDERVRSNFTQIVLITQYDLKVKIRD